MDDTVAVIDLGSNAVRFLVARVRPGKGFHIVRDERVQTRLGASRGVRLPIAAMGQTVVATQRFLRSLNRRRPPRILAVATAAVRDADNAGRLLRRLHAVGVTSIEVLSAEEEGRLGATAAIESLPFEDGMVVDLGGGSLQITEVRHSDVGAVVSLPIGAVRLSRRFIHDDPPSPAQVGALRREVRRQLADLPDTLASDTLVGLGGTIRALARMYLAATGRRRRGLHGVRLPAAAVADLAERLAACNLRKRCRIPGLKADRADVIVAGAAVIDELMNQSRHKAVTVCEQGVRHGILLREAFARGVSA